MIKKYLNKINDNKFYKSLLKNSFWAFLGESGSSFINLIITILLIKLIGNSDYGLLVLAQSYMYIMDILFNIQSWKSVIQYGQKSIVEKKIDKLHSYVKLGMIVDFITAFIGGILSILLSVIIGKIIGWSNDLIACCQIFSLTIFSHLSGTSTAILRILDKFNLVAIQKLITAFIKLISIIILLIVKEKNLLVVASIYCVSDMIGNIILVLFALIVYEKKYGLMNVIKCKLKYNKKFISFTLWGTIGEIVDIPVNYLDVFIVSFLGNDIVSVFKVYKQCIGILQKITSPIQQSIMPQFSELIANKKEKYGLEIVKKIRTITLKLGTPFVLFFGFLSPFWLKMFYGEIYANYWIVLLFYLIVQVFALSYTTIHPYFLALGKPKFSCFYVFISNIVYILVSYILIDKIGLFSIVIAFAIQSLIVIYLKLNKIKKEIN